jgi:hypothetical protein
VRLASEQVKQAEKEQRRRQLKAFRGQLQRKATEGIRGQLQRKERPSTLTPTLGHGFRARHRLRALTRGYRLCPLRD